MPKTKYGIIVQLEDGHAETIAENITSLAPLPDKLGIAASGLLTDLAKGGIMIPSDYAQRIRAATGQLDAVDITERAERTVGMKGDAVVVDWTPDPMWVGYLQNLADNQGLTLRQQVKTVMNHAFEQGWLGQGAPDPFKILLTKEQYEWLEKALNKPDVTGADIIDFVESKTGLTAFLETPEAGDLMAEVFKR